MRRREAHGKAATRAEGPPSMPRRAPRRATRPARGRAAPWIAGVIFALFLLAAGGTTAIMLRRNDAIEQLTTYNVSFIATQASAEMQRLHVRVLGLMAGGRGVGEDDVRLHFDIVVNRINIIGRGDARRILFSQPGVLLLLERLNAFAEEGRPSSPTSATRSPSAASRGSSRALRGSSPSSSPSAR